MMTYLEDVVNCLYAIKEIKFCLLGSEFVMLPLKVWPQRHARFGHVSIFYVSNDAPVVLELL